jgi:nucleoid-associated protein YgaU
MNTKTRGIIWLAGASAVTLGTFLYHNPIEIAGVTRTPIADTTASAVPENKPEVAVAVKPVAEASAEITASFDTVRVEQSGEAVIAGHAAPGSNVAVKWNGQVVGEAVANAEGSFAIVPEKPLAAGTGALTLESTKDGKTVESTNSVAVVVQATAPAVVAQIDPAAPTKVTQAGAAMPAGSVQLGAVDYDDAGNIVFSGKAPAGVPVRFYVDNTLAGETIADPSGNWNFKGSATMPTGTHTLRADALDAKGAVISRAETPFLREEPSKVIAAAEPAAAPAAPVPVADITPVPPVIEIRRIVIQPGSNLWRVSRTVYGKGRMYTLIFEANRDQIKNPNRVYPGQILAAPEQKG